MSNSPDIKIKIVPEKTALNVDINPTPEMPDFIGVQKWLEHIPGVISVNSDRVGALALQAASPLFPLERIRRDTHLVTETYLSQPELSAAASELDGGRYAVRRTLWNQSDKTRPPFKAVRYTERETGELDLYVATNTQISEERSHWLCLRLMEQVPAVNLAQPIDKGYNLQLELASFFSTFVSKAEFASQVVDFIAENARPVTNVWQMSVKISADARYLVRADESAQ